MLYFIIGLFKYIVFKPGGYQSHLETVGNFFHLYVRYATEERFSFIPCCNLTKATPSIKNSQIYKANS